MNTRSIKALLAVIAALLAVNVVVNLPGQEAHAQGEAAKPKAVAIEVVYMPGPPGPSPGTMVTHILWDDGKVDVRRTQ